MPRRTLWLILAAIVVSLACYERAEHNPYGRWFAEAMEAVDRHYVEAVDDEKLFEGALSGMLSRLDDHSTFFSRNEATEFEESLDHEYGGIGIEVGMGGPDKQLTVMTPLVGTPPGKNRHPGRRQDRGHRRPRHARPAAQGHRQAAARQARRQGDFDGGPRRTRHAARLPPGAGQDPNRFGAGRFATATRLELLSAGRRADRLRADRVVRQVDAR